MSRIDAEGAFDCLLRAIPDLPWLDSMSGLRCGQSTDVEALRGTPFVPLVNVRGNQQALVLLSGNVFNVRVVPNYGVDYDLLDRQIREEKSMAERRVRHQVKDCPGVLKSPAILKSFGYDVSFDEPDVSDPKAKS